MRERGGCRTYLDMSLISERAASAALLAASALATKGFAASRAFEARASPSAALDPSCVQKDRLIETPASHKRAMPHCCFLRVAQG